MVTIRPPETIRRGGNGRGNGQTMLPHDLESEEAVLGAMLIDPAVIDQVRNILEPDDFYLYKNSRLYALLLEMAERDEPIDFLTVNREAQARGLWADLDQGIYIMHLQNTVPVSLHAPGYADYVRQAAVRRKLLQAMSNTAQLAYQRGDPLGMLDGMLDEIRVLRNRVSPDPTEPPEQTLSIIPPLPGEARLDYDPADGAGDFVTAYVHYAACISPMTPISFHESAALWLASVVIARRLRLQMHFGTIYPNLYVCWLAPSTLFHKSTALNVAHDLAYKAVAHLLAAQDTTLEAMLSDMAGQEPENRNLFSEANADVWRDGRAYAAQRGLILDELSGLLAGAGRDYNAGLIEAFLRFYECQEHPFTRSTRGQGWLIIRKPYVSLLGASTPAALAKHMVGLTLWENGWWPRFALLAPEESRPPYQHALGADDPAALLDVLERLYNKLPRATWPDPPTARSVIIDQNALASWERYNKAVGYDMVTDSLDGRLWGTYGRLPAHALKVATLLAALDWASEDYTPKRPDVRHANRSQVFVEYVGRETTAPRITILHMARALHIVEEWRASAHRALIAVTVSEEGKFMQQVLAYVTRYGQNGATLRELYRALHKQPSEVEGALKQLISTGEIVTIESRPGRAGGRPTTRFRAADIGPGGGFVTK